MAAALFSQIRIEAVTLLPGEELGDLTQLHQSVAALAGVPLFYVGEQSPFPDWIACSEEELLPLLRGVFRDSGSA
jgi:hypothetical protein